MNLAAAVLVPLLSIVVLFLLSLGDHAQTIDPHEDPIFLRSPLTSETWSLPSGPVRVPFHCYNASAVLVGGYADWAKADRLLSEQGASRKPAKTADGKALALFWLMSYSDTGIGPYSEVVLSFLSSSRDEEILHLPCHSEDPFCLQTHANFNPRAQHVVWKLFLNEQVPIDYGRIILGADKYKAEIQAFATSTHTNFQAAGVIKASIAIPTPVDVLKVLPSLANSMGVVNLFKALTQKSLSMQVAFTPGIAPRFPKHAPVVTSVMKQSAAGTLKLWDKKDLFKLDDPELSSLGFEPTFATHDPSFRFAMGNPHNDVE